MKNKDKYPSTIQYTTDIYLNSLINERQYLLKLRELGGFNEFHILNFGSEHRERLKTITAEINAINARKFKAGYFSHAL
jgi:hypothetical protein